MAAWYQSSSPFLRAAGRPGFSAMPGGRILVGEYPQPADVAWLRDEQGVGAVVCLQDEDDFAAKRIDPRRLVAAYAEHDVEFHHVPVVDGDFEHLAMRLPEIVGIMHRLLGAGRRVYLHCNAGFNRAPTAAIAYLRWHEGLSLVEATRVVKEYRSCAPYQRALQLVFPGETLR